MYSKALHNAFVCNGVGHKAMSILFLGVSLMQRD